MVSAGRQRWAFRAVVHKCIRECGAVGLSALAWMRNEVRATATWRRSTPPRVRRSVVRLSNVPDRLSTATDMSPRPPRLHVIYWPLSADEKDICARVAPPRSFIGNYRSINGRWRRRRRRLIDAGDRSTAIIAWEELRLLATTHRAHSPVRQPISFH